MSGEPPSAETGRIAPGWIPDPLLKERFWIGVLALLAAIVVLLYVRYLFTVGANHDEVEHAHVAFRILLGEVPYRDFYQNHWPAYWLLVTQFVKAFPFSVKVILAGRAVNLLALTGMWFLGLRLLRQVPGGRSQFSVLIYTLGLIVVALPVDFHMARPDPLMVLLGTAGFCLIPLTGALHYRRAIGLGVLFGLAISLSTKILPFLLIVPALIVIRGFRDKVFRNQPGQALMTLSSYALGVLLGLLPVAVWVFQNGLFDDFYFDVFALNADISKPWFLSFRFLSLTLYTPAILGLLAWLWARWSTDERDENGVLIVAMSFACGLALAFLARHPSVYNLQMMVVPLAVAFTVLANVLWVNIRILGYRLLAVAAILAFPVTQASTHMALIGTDIGTPLKELQAIMNLAKPELKTCTAFSPNHPVFCKSVSQLSNGWDLLFLDVIDDPLQLQRFQDIWSEGIRKTIELQPDIILRRNQNSSWEKAASLGFVEQADLDRLDHMQYKYEVVMVGDNEFWVKIGF